MTCANTSPFERPVQLERFPRNTGSDLLVLDRGEHKMRIFRVCDGRAQQLSTRRLIVDDCKIARIAAIHGRELIVIEEGGRCEVARITDNSLYSTCVLPIQNYEFSPFCATTLGSLLFIGGGPEDIEGSSRIIGVTRDGKIRWDWRPERGSVGYPVSVTAVQRLGLVVADTVLHQVLMVSWTGQVLWEFGEKGCPGPEDYRLSEPRSVALTPTNTLLISDSRNSRLIEIGLDGILIRTVACVRDNDGASLGPFDYPESAIQIDNGDLLVADSGNNRVLCATWSGSIRWCAGERTVPRRLLSFPRSFERLGRHRWLVADTNNNRCIEVDDANRVLWQFGEGKPRDECTLFWPRCARRLRDGSTVIADSRNSRVLLISLDGRTLCEMQHIVSPSGNRLKLEDPHDIVPIGRNHFLLTDAALNMVARIDFAGSAAWTVGGPESLAGLSDPHQVTVGHRGTVFVANCAGVAVVSADGSLLKVIADVKDGNGNSIDFTCPKAIDYCKGRLVVGDPHSPYHELVFLDWRANIGWSCQDLETQVAAGDSAYVDGHLLGTRCVRWLGLKRLAVADVGRHRIVEAARIGSDP